MHGRMMDSRLARMGAGIALAGAMLVPACSLPGVALVFKGRVADTTGKAVRAFSLSLERGSGAKSQPVAVKADQQGRYEARVMISGAVSGRTLGPSTEKVVIRATAPGHKPKALNATADQVLVTEPNQLNLSLEPGA